MARCRCSEASCNCRLTAGSGVTVTGTGAIGDPWVVQATPQSTGTINTLDTPSLDLVQSGSGVPVDPTVIQGHVRLQAILSLLNSGDVQFTTTGTGTDGSPLTIEADLKCLDCAVAGNPGDVLTRQTDGSYKPQAVSVAAGAIFTAAGLAGTGVNVNPLRVDICTYGELRGACTPPVAPITLEHFDTFASWATSGSPAPAIIPGGKAGPGAQLQNVSSNTGIAAYTIPLAQQFDTIVVGFWWKVDTFANEPHIIEFWSDTNTTFHAHVSARTDGSVGWVTGGILRGWSAADKIHVNTWHYIEAKAKLGDAGFWEIRVDGLAAASLNPGDTKQGGTKTVWDAIRLTTHTLGTITAVYDELYVRTGPTADFGTPT